MSTDRNNLKTYKIGAGYIRFDERETVIVVSQTELNARITTSIQSWITKLLKHTHATVLRKGLNANGAVGELQVRISKKFIGGLRGLHSKGNNPQKTPQEAVSGGEVPIPEGEMTDGS